MKSLKASAKNSPTKIIDPVCGMEMETGRTNQVLVHKGDSYWFCSEVCRGAFATNPGKYLKPKSDKKKGWFGRYLKRMAKTAEKEFGRAGPKCH